MSQMPNDKPNPLDEAEYLNQAMRAVGFDWDGPLSVISKVKEELAELAEAVTDGHDKAHILEEYGDLLLVCLHLGRHLEVNPRDAISQAVVKCRTRFEQMQDMASSQGTTLYEMSLSQLEQLWNKAKQVHD